MTDRTIYTAVGAMLALVWVLLGWALATAWDWVVHNSPPRVDCSMAEFHPDYPPRAREKCREARSAK